MKELSIEEKAKRYDEVVARLRHAFNSNRCTLGFMNEILRYPKESEDEKIRKALIEYFNEQCDMSDWNGIYGYQVVAWLEKQGNSFIKWNKNTKDNKPQFNHSVLMLTKSGISEGEWLGGNQWQQYRWSGIVRDSDVTGWMELSVLEKQGEQKLPIEKLPEEMKTIGESLGFTTQKECDEYNQMVSDLIMSDNKVKPKFHEGEWVVFIATESIYQVEKIENFQYTLRHIFGGSMPLLFSDEDMIRAWTIQDAKNGDVLAGIKNDVILIFRGIGNTRWDDVIDYYCYYECYQKDFVVQEDVEHWGDIKNNQLRPATKEQRELLFQKMKEAGYEWDENNKILKEIVEDEEEPQNYKNQIMSEITDLVKYYIKQKPSCSEAGEDIKEALRTEYEKGRADAFAQMQKEWSDEDKERIKNILSVLDVQVCWDGATGKKENPYQKEINWLKSLRTKNHWKPSDDDINLLKEVEQALLGKDCHNRLVDFMWKLKKLKGE